MKTIFLFGILCLAVVTGYFLVYVAQWLLQIPVNVHNMNFRWFIVSIGVACLVLQPFVIYGAYILRRYMFLITCLGVLLSLIAIINFKYFEGAVDSMLLMAVALSVISYVFGKWIYFKNN
jgi:hypothetical protein